jgi:hypothetical protein
MFLAGNCALAAVSVFALFRVPATTHYPGLGIVLLAFGFASTNVVFGATVAASSGVANDEQGLAGALVNATRQIGSAVGVAALLSIVTIDASANTSTAQLGDGFRLALACAAGLAGAATLLSLRIPSSRAAHPSDARTVVEPSPPTSIYREGRGLPQATQTC